MSDNRHDYTSGEGCDTRPKGKSPKNLWVRSMEASLMDVCPVGPEAGSMNTELPV